MKRHCGICGSTAHDRRTCPRLAGQHRPKHYRRALGKHRRNPGRKAPPSHDLFGERSHKTSLFDEVRYAAVPKPKRAPPKHKGKAAGRSQGRLSFGLGLFD